MREIEKLFGKKITPNYFVVHHPPYRLGRAERNIGTTSEDHYMTELWGRTILDI